MKVRVPRQLRSKTAVIAACAVIAGAGAGVAVADEMTTMAGPDQVAQDGATAEADAERGEQYFDSLWQGAREKADSGALSAEVNQREAERILSDAIDPPDDPEKADQVEKEMIELTEKLRASGDLRPLGNGPSPLQGFQDEESNVNEGEEAR